MPGLPSYPIVIGVDKINALSGNPGNCELQVQMLDILSRFISLPLDEVDLEIDRTFGLLGVLTGADRVYTFAYNHTKGLASNTREWCASGIRPEIEYRQDVPVAQMPDWIEKHRRGFPVHIADVDALPPGLLRDTLAPQGIRTVLTLPMMNGQECIGFVGFDWVRDHHDCTAEEHHILQVFARMLTNVTIRKQADKERQHLQNQLAHAVRMESMGRLAGGVAHDFNNMLTVINCHSRLALDKLPDGDPLRTHLAAIAEAAQHSSELTRRLLTFARKQETAPEVIDLNAHISATLSMLRRMIGEHIALTFQPGAYLWPVKADIGQLDQVLANLCVNARDAIGEGAGRIMIETANVIHEHAPGDIRDKNAGCSDYVVISVTDNGCGMEPETIEHIFEPFFTTKTADKGTGLGLATVFGIVRQSRGFVEVISHPGRGSSFSVFLPRAGI